MTKKTVSTLVIAMTITGAGFSQETPITATPETGTIKKNEIGFNTAPIASILLGSEPYAPKLSLSYKRVINERNALRFSSSYQFNWGDGQWYNLYNYDIVLQTDSTQIRRYRQSNNGDRAQVNTGYEWRRGKKKIKYFFGADLILGHTSHSYNLFDQSYVLEKGLPYQSFSGGDTLYHFAPDNTSQTSYVQSEKTHFVYGGVSPFLGLIYPLSKRFLLSVQMGVDASFSYGKTTHHDYTKNTTYDSFSSSLDFNSAGIVNDLSLVYRF